MSPAVDRGGAGLLERDRELVALERALADARSGAGRVLVIEAPAGLGKSALLATAVTRARSDGMTVLRAVCAQLERDFPFGVVRQLFEPLRASLAPREWERLCAGAAAPARRALEEPAAEHAAAPDAPYPVLHGLYWLAAAVAGRRPLLIAVDDVHAADRPSLRWLAHFCRRLEGLRALVALTVRVGEPSTDPEALGDVLARAAEPALRPAELGLGATARLVRGRLHPAATAGFCADCHRATGGNPLLLRALLDDLAAGGVTGTPGHAPPLEAFGLERVASAVTGRLGRLSPHALSLAQALAVLGDGARLTHAAALAGLALEPAARAADTARAARVLAAGERLAFAHPVVQAALYQSIGPARRALLHAAAARRLTAENAPDDRVSTHLLATEPRADTAVVDTLRAAARSALARGASDSAVAYLRRALAEPPLPEARPELLLELGFAASYAGDPDAAEHLREAVRLAAGPRELLRGTLALGRTLMNSGRNREALEAFQATAQHPVLADDDSGLVLDGALLAAASLERDGAALAAELANRLRDRLQGRADAPASVLAQLAAEALRSNEPAERVAELAGRALDGNERVLPEAIDRPPYFYAAAHSLTLAEHFDDARRLYDLTLTDARRLGSLLHFVLASAFRAALEFRVGLVADAEADARQALGADPTRAPPAWAALAAATVALALCERGELEQAEAELERAWPGERHAGMLTFSDLLWARGRVRLARARPEHALEDLLAAGRLLLELRAPSPAYAAWRSDAALALLALDRQPEARRLAAEELELARRFGGPRAIGVALRAAGLVEGGATGLALLEQAASTLAGSAAELEHARALTDLGATLRRRGQRAASREPLRSALDLAHHCSATALADRAHAELVAAGARPRRRPLAGPAALTASEQRVARLAADGLSNRQIAQTLYITEHTVATHLHRTYQKLDIQSRAQLAAALADDSDH